MRRARASWLVAAAVLPLLGGCCASFRVGRLEQVGAWPVGPPEDAAKLRSVSLAFQGATVEAGQETPLPPRDRVVFRNASHWAYHGAERFTNVRPAPELADLRVDLRLLGKHERSPAALRWAHALTLGLVPAWERHEWTLVTTVADQEGKQLWRSVESAAIVTWHGLLLVLAYPFAPPPGVAANCMFDLNRAALRQGVARDIF
jgi:hypothetical protein